MDRTKLKLANRLSDFIETYRITISRYCENNNNNDFDAGKLGCALRDIREFAPQESGIIKDAIKKAFRSIEIKLDDL